MTEDTYAENQFTSNEDLSFMPEEEIVPETPRKDVDFDDQNSYIEDTPQKDKNLERRLNTPLGSTSKNDFPIPRVHRRKSLSNLEHNSNSSSPEIKRSLFKRHLDDSAILMSAKYQKTDDFSSIPKARAALFQDKFEAKNDEPIKPKGFVLNTKSFYGAGSDSEILSRRSLEPNWKMSELDSPKKITSKKPSPPTSYHSFRRSLGKKSRKGEVNLGVRHGIRRPKHKRPPPTNVPKIEKKEIKENVNPKMKSAIDKFKEHPRTIKGTEKFFKSTVENKINVAQKNDDDFERASKRARMEINFDVADLTVEEPAVEAAVEQNKANILKVIQEDWADEDEDDTINVNSVAQINYNFRAQLPLSPKKSNIILKNLTMSPASELSSMASTMNLKDVPDLNEKRDNLAIEENNTKYFPLFSKGFAPDLPDK